jgi:cytochrome P450
MEHLTPLSAPTAADPYEYYARLARTCPFAFDEGLRAWVAASAHAVETILCNRDLRVRPASEPVPAAMVGTPLGEIFARLVRMNDGPRHVGLKTAVAATLEGWRVEDVSAYAHDCAPKLAERVVRDGPETLSSYLYDVPASVVARMLGIVPNALTLAAIAQFAKAIAPAASADDIARGVAATVHLRRRISAESEDTLANAMGFLFQSYDATAGLIGNAFTSLACDVELLRRVIRDETALDTLLAASARYDPSVHNTRRFSSTRVEVLGKIVQGGDTVLVILAAANYDPLAERSYTFGCGPHSCAGTRVAFAIAKAGVRAVLESRLDPSAVVLAGYRPSLNTRVPIFAAQERRSARSRGST